MEGLSGLPICMGLLHRFAVILELEPTAPEASACTL